MSGAAYERELKRLLEARGWCVVRSAGSMGEGDLSVKSTDDISFDVMMSLPVGSRGAIVEAKKTSGDEPAFYLGRSEYRREQVDALFENVERGVPVVWAVRRTSGSFAQRAWHLWVFTPAWGDRHKKLPWDSASTVDDVFGPVVNEDALEDGDAFSADLKREEAYSDNDG